LPDLDARRHTNLYEQQALAVGRIFLQKPIQRLQPLGNALGVVDAIDADAQYFIGQSQVLTPADF
jgi:hypothetical protein